MDNEIFSTEIFRASIEFGIGCVGNLADHVKKFDVARLLIVTDEGVMKAGIIDKVVQHLESSGIEYSVFHDVQPNPIDKNVMDGLNAYRENDCDGILGVGGGSPIDTAKAIRAVVGHPGHISNYYLEPITDNLPTLIAIPTTSGTGTEVSRGGIITDTRINQKKVVVTGPPSLALVDPELTSSMPPFLTAATGMDALCHSVEAYVSRRYNPLAGAVAIAGIRLVAENLRRAVEDGTDMEARKNMAMASTMGALAFSKGLGAVHSLAHQLSTDADIPHGVANAIMLPHVMEFNMESAPQKHVDIAQAMGVNTQSMSSMEAARASVESVRQLSRDTGIPYRLRDVGMQAESISIMAEKAMVDHCHASNPRDCNLENMTALYKAAF
ncbi:iron-containing alcohol dehydrogenase family protein [Candidatus Poribacteria bacterium]